MAGFKRILFISDLHAPFMHACATKFLRAIKKKYKPDKVILSGDEQDLQSISMHNHNPDLPGPHDEISGAIKQLRPIFNLFPEAIVLDSNHGSLVYRRAQISGLPTRAIKTPKEMLGAPSGWRWVDDIVLKASNGKQIYFCHGRSKNSMKNSQLIGMNFCQGHHHSTFEIQYWANSLGLYWGLTVGCLIDKDAIAFAYGKTCNAKPILGCAIIINGIPKLLPMVLDKNGYWTGELP
jgi:hypothetical protein